MGFSLHANTHVPAHRRDALERLLRYTARGAVSLERLEVGADGDLLYTFTHPWSDGTTGIKLSPLELLEKLAALVPLQRVHLVRYGGCLAPHSKLRSAIIPTPRQQGVEEPDASPPSPYWGWARLLKRVFAIDMARCPVCQQGTLRIIAATTEGSVIRKILPAKPPRPRVSRADRKVFEVRKVHQEAPGVGWHGLARRGASRAVTASASPAGQGRGGAAATVDHALARFDRPSAPCDSCV